MPHPYRCPVPGAVLGLFAGPLGRYDPGHRGVDLVSPPGEAVRAPAAGRVSFAGPVAGRPLVVVDHGGGVRTTLEPVAPLVLPGTVVRTGTVVGRTAGPAHCPTVSCLHLGVRRGDDYVDPLDLLGREPVVLLPLGPSGRGAAG